MFRSALRSSTNAAFRSRAVARRYASASAHGGHSNKTGDATWLMGSAAVFVPLGAYLLFTGSPAAAQHAAEQTTPIKTAKALGGNILPEDAAAEVNTEAESAHKGSGRVITDKTTTGYDRPNSGANLPSDKASDVSSHPQDGSDSDSDSDSASASEGKSKDDGEGRKAEDIPQKELEGKAAKDSLKQAESVNVPRVAMAAQEEGDSSSSSSSSADSKKFETSGEGRSAEDIPDKELQDSLHKAEDACVPRATMAHPESE